MYPFSFVSLEDACVEKVDPTHYMLEQSLAALHFYQLGKFNDFSPFNLLLNLS